MMRCFIFLFLTVLQLQGQEILFEGHVYDHKTKEPIPYVNLSFLNTLKGTSTDDNGHFYIDVQESFLEKQLHISSLGYNDTIVTAKDIYKSKKFHLVEESFELDEVVVTQSLGNSDVLNPVSSYSLTSGFSSSSTPWVLALYFPNIGAQKKFVSKVTVFFQKDKNFKRPASKFRLRIYDVDVKTKKPNQDVLRKSVVLETQKDKDYVSIDLEALHIKIPKQGVYVGLEWLFVPYNWYATTLVHPLTNKKVVEDRFAPTFGGVYNKNQNYKAMVYGMGQWTDFTVKSKDKAKNFIPAISLKVSKE
ncbi:carboxypeptidase-like regulatory domain-containing protein [uncultured Maribacter sp.]|uniref:carboxypeptidase-like regulatory domain-containing protein n=1 Tax=uncultured Maribacter sp. TaxID=431308 RepID=UPI002619F4E5|nr:carboxypeptidase-like regulatory domain-containing protein [uncultured Maribacter sp.]